MNEYTFEVIASPYGETIKRTDSTGNEVWIPNDPTNADYQKYLASLEASA